MRILFTTYAEKTHFLGMVPTAWALQTAGHEVRVASQPELTDVIVRAGLTAVPVGRDHTLHQFMKRHEGIEPVEPPLFDFEDLSQEYTWEALKWAYRQFVPYWYRMVNHTMVDELVAYARDWRPDLVIWEPVTYAGAVAAKACGAAHGRLMWGADLFGRMRHHFLRLRAEHPHDREDLLGRWLRGYAAKYGFGFSEDMTTGQFTIDNIPDPLRKDPRLGLDIGLHYLPMRYVPYNGIAVVPPWLREPPTRPRVGITLGVSSTERLDGYAVDVQDLLDALADLDIEVVATLPQEQQDRLDHVPANARLTSFVPLNVLAPTCAALIHHGGNGTYCTTVLHGVPQLIIPFFFDGSFRAQYIADQGAGLTLPRQGVTAADVRQALVRLLDEPSFRSDAARLGVEMRDLPTPNALVPTIVELTARYRPGAAINDNHHARVLVGDDSTARLA